MAALLRPDGLPALRRLCLGSSPWPNHLWDVEPARRLRGALFLRFSEDWRPGDLVGGIAAGIAGSALLAACVELELAGGPRQAFCQALARTTAVMGLAALRLIKCGLGDEEVEALASSGRFGSLCELSLAGNQLSDRAVDALLEAPFVGRLTRLDLSSTGISAEGVTRLARTDALAGLRELYLFGVPAANAGALKELRQRYATVGGDA